MSKVCAGEGAVNSRHLAGRARRAGGHAFPILSADERDRCARAALELAVSRVFGISGDQIWQGTRGLQHVAQARQIAMYLAHVVCRLSLTDVGRMFGRDRTTVAHACLKIEIMRDNPVLDRALDLLSWALPTMVRRGAPPDLTH